ncbi:MAG TPA: dihydropteroate synthase, partial [Pirellulaceae bacterium]|nr:dihydropteroate synthase [Pirellulaceae bacterium]
MASPLHSDSVHSWRLRSRTLTWGKFPLLMGIVNVTPDSFSDGGQWNDPQAAVAHGIELWQQGADILDIGGESTRPYSQPVSEAEELRRTIPVIRELAEKTQAIISVDTSKARIAMEAIAAGAEIINDVTGLTGDSQMERVAVETGAGVCVMHMQGTPQSMQDNPSYVDVVAEVKAYLESRRRHLVQIGVVAEKIALDPGLGFGKTHLHNWELIGRIREFHDLGCPLL